jgi:hypothetical protein
MGEVARGGRTVLFVSHNMAFIEICDAGQVDFLKIDIEGAELELVLGSDATV